MKKILILLSVCLILLFGSNVQAQNITFEDLPQPNLVETELEVQTSGLSGIYTMSKGFVNLVLKPFSDLEEVLVELLQEFFIDELDPLTVLEENATKILNFEIGYLVCVGFGVVFILLVVFGGLIMCCCRCCCGKCGGRYEQSKRRMRSKWRNALATMLFVVNIFILLPCIFIFLTNGWLTTIVEKAPQQLNTSLDNVDIYVDNIDTQISFIPGEFSKVNASVINNLENIDKTVGEPLEEEFRRLAQPTIDQLGVVDQFLNNTIDTMTKTNQTLNDLKTGFEGLRDQLAAVTSAINSTLSSNANCTALASCQALVNQTNEKEVSGADITEIDDGIGDLNNATDELKDVDIQESIDLINTELDKIPELVVNQSQSAVDDAVKQMDEIYTQINDLLNTSVFQDTFDQIKNATDTAKSTIHTAEEFIDEYDLYRIIAVYVIGGMILVIVVFYFFGLLMGQTSYIPNPEGRTGMSKCGGVFLMSAAGLSFIFGWLLMLLTIVLFTVGGHGERYVSQPLAEPYEGLKFLDKVVSNTSILGENAVELPQIGDEPLSLEYTVRSCSEDRSLYETFRIENMFNLTELSANVTEQLSKFRDEIANLNISLDGIDVYNNDTEESLDSLTTTGLEDIDLIGVVNTLKDAVNELNLTGFATDIGNVANDLRAVDPTLANELDDYAANITAINNNLIPPINSDVTELESNTNDIQTIITEINSTVDATKNVLETLDKLIASNATDEVTRQLLALADLISSDINAYTTWIVDQVSTNLGTCLPLYAVYNQLETILGTYIFNVMGGLWFALGWALFFLIPAAIMAMKLAKFYRGGKTKCSQDDDLSEDMEMQEYTSLPQQKSAAAAANYDTAVEYR